MTDLKWRVNDLASILHVAAAARCSTLSDARIARAVSAPVAALDHEIMQTGAPSEAVWSALCATACQQTEIEATVRAVLHALPTRAAGDTGDQEVWAARGERMIGLIGDVGEGIRQVLPGLHDDLWHRGRPLREQWDARGPGFMHRLGAASALNLPTASVFLVTPVLAGGGDIDPAHTALRIEALLANTVPELPEPVRLGWLLARLACHHALRVPAERPRHAGRHTIALAMVPAALDAAAAVELASCNVEMVQRAIVAWRDPTIVSPPDTAAQARQVWDWWQARRVALPWGEAVDELSDCLDA